MLTATKGTILYHRDTGRPSVVKATRKVLTGSKLAGTRYTLACGDWFVISEQRPESIQWTDTQTPELARKWAKQLEQDAADRAERVRFIEAERLTRLANRDRLNAPPHITIPEYDGDECRITLTYAEQNRAGDIITTTRQYAANIYQQHTRRVGEDGEWTRTQEWLVNWSALGSVSPEVARAYALAILDAADLAAQRNGSALHLNPTLSERLTHA